MILEIGSGIAVIILVAIAFDMYKSEKKTMGEKMNWKLLNIGCKGMANVSCNLSGIIELELQDVDMDFLEDVPTSEIAKWHSK